MKHFLKPLVPLALFAGLQAHAGGWEIVDADGAAARQEVRIVSTDTLRLKFPYDGENRATLTVRSNPDRAILSVQKGQILCYLASPCTINVRFDDGPVQIFYGGRPSDGAPTTVTLAPTVRFLSALRKARRIQVQLAMYEAGEQLLEFGSSQPLAWPPGQ